MGLVAATDDIRRAMFVTLRSSFDHTNVRGLSSDPTFTQNPQRTTEEPYINLYSVGDTEVYENKNNSAIEYFIRVEAVVRYRSRRGGSSQAQEMIQECKRILRTFTEFPLTETGHNIFKTATGETTTLHFKERGANYAKVVMPLYVTARFTASPQTAGTPVQTPIYGNSGFMFPPTANFIELYDTGTLLPSMVYEHNNNGFDFVDASYVLDPSSDGAVAPGGGILVDEDDVVVIVSTINYISETERGDPPALESVALTATTTFNRSRSFRFGTLTGTTIDLTDITEGVQFGTLNPIGETVTFDVVAGNRPFIAYDATLPDLATIQQQGFSNDILSQFTQTTQNGYKLYIQTIPFAIDNSNGLTAILS